ncbi:MAG: tryptophan-rich sensory protein [Methylobacterium sp.]|nr:tryptophan-rich sensory protein [Methylobacterium sp.]MCA3601154.1 tryptophan-rich sensory protein [Methylobacterium sp.]MCA3609548.1 tryptophan-rich sensory protein [Methylobacterium sp.]MCA3618128.1 tryptophan-rich sensory protein [Methylobacterium sp.]MCA3620140.1 tryptophan-rich sensory protein [Methylobacterium sp.]
MTQARGPLARQVVIAALAAAVVMVAGGFATMLGPWYEALRKPAWQPPGWVFGPAWTTISILAVIAAVLAWRRAETLTMRRWLIVAFALNGGLNFLWSVLFFTLRRPDWALVEVVFLWLSILLLVILCSSLSRLSGVLLMPYLLWVSFAAFLNWTIVGLNAPFAALFRSIST